MSHTNDTQSLQQAPDMPYANATVLVSRPNAPNMPTSSFGILGVSKGSLGRRSRPTEPSEAQAFPSDLIDVQRPSRDALRTIEPGLASLLLSNRRNRHRKERARQTVRAKDAFRLVFYDNGIVCHDIRPIPHSSGPGPKRPRSVCTLKACGRSP